MLVYRGVLVERCLGVCSGERGSLNLVVVRGSRWLGGGVCVCWGADCLFRWSTSPSVSGGFGAI